MMEMGSKLKCPAVFQKNWFCKNGSRNWRHSEMEWPWSIYFPTKLLILEILERLLVGTCQIAFVFKRSRNAKD